MKPMNIKEFYDGYISILTFFDDIGAKDLKNIKIDSNTILSVSEKLAFTQNPNTFYKRSFNLESSPTRNDELHAIYAQNNYKLNLYSEDGHTIRYVGDNKRDSIVGHIATYIDKVSTKMFIQTKSKIKLISKTSVYEKPITRFSFLPGTLLTDLFYPIAISEQGSLKPAIYIDGTSISTNHISIDNRMNNSG